ncbi:MAG: DUF2784 domain-containing protein [Thiomonas sp.]|nr:DUF2784 domain-containing protein [Betaproteobacteria bacterium]MDE2270147.1 DUF2784 domain-containing protein [Betaproteobacteria bacterium]
MPALLDLQLAHLVLAVHLGVIVFNVAGLIVVPLGAWRRWRWVRGCVWRAAHLLSMAVVAAQAALGRACFLTLWQSALMQDAGQRGYTAGLIQTWIDHLIFWNLPLAVFTVIYLAVGAYTLALWWWVPPRCRRVRAQPSSKANAASSTSGQTP